MGVVDLMHVGKADELICMTEDNMRGLDNDTELFARSAVTLLTRSAWSTREALSMPNSISTPRTAWDNSAASPIAEYMPR